jgi:endogenous inhibitor of DNA gyrase (YacG/DUF329 family)
MLAKCAACKSRIVAGGLTYLNRRFCSADCVANFQVALTDHVVPAEVVDRHIQEVFASPCPVCGREGGIDLYTATRVSAFLIFFQIDSRQRVSCARCGRKHRLLAAVHCFFLGWWGPKAAFCNLFVLPTNLIAAAFVRTPKGPSVALRMFVKARMAETVVPQLLAVRAAAEQAVPSEQSAEPGTSADRGQSPVS